MNNREPQVGDVRQIFRTGPCVVYRGRGFWAILNRLYPLNYICKYYPDSSGVIHYSEYRGKLAPRYKRLFGIYYIKDKSNDQ